MVISTLLLFQNCGPQMLSNMDVPSQVEPLADKPVIPDCQFNRTNMFVGDSVIAYQTSTVPTGNTCVSESRVCRGGRLSGSFQYSTCLPGVPAACLQNGTTIPHGRSIKFYQTNSVQFGAACTSEDRTCNNGSLSGSFTFSECNVQQPGECVVSGLRFAHRTQKLFFKNLTVPYGQNCQSEYRQCHNGSVVNGSFTELTCGIIFQRIVCMAIKLLDMNYLNHFLNQTPFPLAKHANKNH